MRKLEWLICLGMVLALCLPVPSVAEDLALVDLGTAAVRWDVQGGDFEKMVLTVSAPDGKVIRRELKAGEAIVFELDAAAKDGAYRYELRGVPRIDASVRRELAAARRTGNEAAVIERLQAAGKLPREGAVQSGSFLVQQGAIVSRDIQERPETAAGTGGGPQIITGADQVIPDDLIVQQSLCVGFDCVNNESFGFDTIRLKENNTRIKFEDTSVGTFPTNDWQLTANDSASGGASKFSIEDITGAKVPFTITAGASTNSIFVDSTGRVGFRTSTPVLDLHVNTSNTPSIRLEQNNSGGFTAQTWDIGANEANFFVRDVTGGSLLSLRIRPGAPTSSLDISSDGDVGIGTASPSQKLEVEKNQNANTIAVIENTNTGDTANGVWQAKSDVAETSIIAHGSGRVLTRYGVSLGGKSELIAANNTTGLLIGTVSTDDIIMGTNNINRLQINGTTGAVTISGALTVTGAKNFAMVDPADSRRAIYFAALEGPEAGTYFRGTAKTKDGNAVIELPGYFSRITEAERITVQLTPVGNWGQLYVAEKTPEKLVIRVAPGTSDLEFDYLVQGVRRGYLDYEVERANELPNQ